MLKEERKSFKHYICFYNLDGTRYLKPVLFSEKTKKIEDAINNMHYNVCSFQIGKAERANYTIGSIVWDKKSFYVGEIINSDTTPIVRLKNGKEIELNKKTDIVYNDNAKQIWPPKTSKTR